MKFATSLEQQFLAHVPNMDGVLQFQRKLKSCVAGYQEFSKQLEKPKKFLQQTLNKKPIETENNEDNSALEQNSTY